MSYCLKTIHWKISNQEIRRESELPKKLMKYMKPTLRKKQKKIPKESQLSLSKNNEKVKKMKNKKSNQ